LKSEVVDNGYFSTNFVVFQRKFSEKKERANSIFFLISFFGGNFEFSISQNCKE
jgi:hypothetical protein